MPHDDLPQDTFPRVPAKFVPKVLGFRECSYGAARATLVLKSGRVIFDVILGGDSIAKVGEKLVKSEADLDFSTADIVKVLPG
jgi:hypothetical protein